MNAIATKQVKIGIDAREFVSTTTGIARLLSGFLERLMQVRPDWDILFFGNDRTDLPFPLGRGRLLRLSEPVTFWWDQIAMTRAAKREGIHLFFSPYYKVPFSMPCPVIHVIHDLIPLTSPCYQSLRYFFPRVAMSFLGKRYARKAAVTVTDSFYTKQLLLKKFRLSEDRVQVIYPGVPASFHPASDRDASERITMKYRLRHPYFLYVGNFKPHKRVDVLIRAFQKLPSSLRQNLSLILAGKRTSREAALFDRLVEALGVREEVIFPGFIEDEDLPALYGGATQFIFPSSDEGFGFPPLEAMACGIPVITTRAASLPEIVREAAILVDSGDIQGLSRAMERLLGDAQERKRRIQLGLERARSFSIEAQTEAFVSLFEKVLGG